MADKNNHEHGKGVDRSKPMDIICALITLRDDLKKWVANNLRVKLDKNLGVDNANKILSIDAEGNIIPIDNTTGGGSGGDFEQVQADWEENDATSNAYIKNRPFYVNQYNLPFQRMTFEPSTYNSNVYKTSLIGLVAADGVEGQEYVVEWDGVEYVTTCRKVTFDLVNNDLINSIRLDRVIGNPALWNSEGVIESHEQDSGEPFFLQLSTTLNTVANGVGMDLDCVITKDTSPIHTIRVFGTDNVVQLDEKFIPDSVKLPSVTEDDNGKTIGVVGGEWSIVDMPEGGNGGSVHWDDVTGKPFIKENKRIFVDHSKVDTSIAFTSAELNATFVRLTEETLSRNEIIGATLNAIAPSGETISKTISYGDIYHADSNCLSIMADILPILVCYRSGQYTVSIAGIQTTIQVPEPGCYTTDAVIDQFVSSEISTGIPNEYLDNKCLSILETSSKPTEILHEIEFTNQWNDLFNVFAYLNPIDEETFNTWNANTEPVIVKYDNVEYICMPQALSFNGESGISVGNLASFEGGTGNNEPFAITCGYDNVSGLYFAIIGSTVDMEPTAHSVAIYLQDETYKIKDEYLEDFIKEINSKIKVYQVGDLSEIIETPAQGDQAIVTSTIKDDLKSYTAYIWDETLNEGAGNWVAMDGNYNAENVYFANDMMVTKEIGYITLDKGRGTIPSKGKNLAQVFEDMFVKEQNPTTINPSVSITLTGAGSYEVGTTVTDISYSASFEDGEYSYGPEPTGVTVRAWEIKDSNDNTVNENATNGNISDITVTDSTNYFITAKATHTDGDPPLTNKGNNCTDASKQIVADTKDKKSGSITGYRKTFYGTTTTKADTLGSSDIRALSGKSDSALANGSNFSITIPVGAVRVIIAYPASLRNLTSVLDKNDSNANIVSSFIARSGSDAGISVPVYDATGNSGAMDYKVYILDYAKAITVENTYEVTI